MISDRRIFKKTGALLLGLTYSIISFGSESIREVASASENVETINTPKPEPKIVASTRTNVSNSQLEKLIKDQYNNKSIDLNVNTSLKNMRDSGSYERPNINTYTANRKTQQGTPDMRLSKEQLLAVAERIFQNETGGVRNNLVDWNDGENFPSLGIGHFTWFKASGGRRGFGDSLPDMVAYYRQQGIQLPKLLSEFRYSPWSSKSELMAKKANGDKDIQELIAFFDNTRDVQVMFIYERLKGSLDKMLEASSNKENLRNQFDRMVNTPNGLYALIDYVNFKGEGLKGVSSYNNIAWGLRQVLENMKGTAVGQSALVEFSNSAKDVLARRVRNAPRNERRWLQGWYNRVDTYKTFEIGRAY